MRVHLRLTSKHVDIINIIKNVKNKGTTKIVDYIVESIRIRNELEKKYGSYENILLCIGTLDFNNTSIKQEFDNSVQLGNSVMDEHEMTKENILSDYDSMFDN